MRTLKHGFVFLEKIFVLLLVSGVCVLLSFCSTSKTTSEGAKSIGHDLVIDTLSLFDSKTFEERIVIYQAPATMKWKKTKPLSEQISNDAKKYVLDTVMVYDHDTYKLLLTKIVVTPKRNKMSD